MDDSAAPAPWSIEPGTASGSDVLRLGHRALPLAEIVSCRAASTAEINVGGQMASVALFMSAGAALLVLVAMGALSARFLVGCILFCGIGLMSLSDLLRGHTLVVHRVIFRLAHGATHTFTSPHIDDCRTLMSALDRRGIAAWP